MLASWVVLPLVLSVTDPHLTLLYAVAPDACVSEEMLVEELRPRLADMTFLAAGDAGEAIGYRLSLAAAVVSESTTAVSVELLDPLGSPLLAQPIECGDNPRLAARQSAVLVEGHVRLHMQRFGKLLAVIRDSDTNERERAAGVVEKPPARPPEPIAWLGASVWGLADLQTFRPTAGGALSAELAVWPWLAPHLDLAAALPLSWSRASAQFRVQETTLALGGRAVVWPGSPSVFVEAGYVLYLVTSRAAGATATTQTALDAYSGIRAAAGGRYLLAERWALVAGARADFLPRYPTLSWRGEAVVTRGPWRGALEVGAEYGF